MRYRKLSDTVNGLQEIIFEGHGVRGPKLHFRAVKIDGLDHNEWKCMVCKEVLCTPGAVTTPDQESWLDLHLATCINQRPYPATNPRSTTTMGQTSFTIYDPTDAEIAAIRAVLAGDEDQPAAEGDGADEDVKASKKKGKKSKSEKDNSSDESGEKDEAPAERVNYTKAKLNKMVEAKDRAKLTTILNDLGVDESEYKGKQAPTLMTLILGKQDELKAAEKAAASGKSDTKSNDEEEWVEQPAPKDKKGDKKAKADKSKKKGKKGK